MAKKPMNVEEALEALGDVDGGVLQDEVAAVEVPAEEVETARVRLSPAEEFVAWVASQQWGAAYSDSVTRLLEDIQKRARALL